MLEFLDNHNNLKSSLEEVKNIIIKKNKSSERFLDHSVEYLVSTGGKMLRPLFVILGAGFGPSTNQEKTLHLAATIEMLHLATLIHDDIVDDSEFRRNSPTIQSKYSKEYAVYMGDYLFTQCFLLLSEYDFDRKNIKQLAKAISKVCIGEMKQNQMRFTINRSVKEYIKVASGKTAALFSISLASGANATDSDQKTVKILSKIGYNIGMAFQIIDDLLDYTGDDAIVGKDLNKDLMNGYYTLPIIYGLRSEDGDEIEKLLKSDHLNSHDKKKLLNYLTKNKTIKRTQNLANKYSKRALKYIEQLPDTYEKDILNSLVPILLKRAL